MSLPQVSNEKHLIFGAQFSQDTYDYHPLENFTSSCWIWSDRLLLVEYANKHAGDYWNFTAFDLLMNESRLIRFRKTDQKFKSFDIYPLNEEFGFIVESVHTDPIQQINLVKFNWNVGRFKRIECVKKEAKCVQILVDNLQSSKFVLKWYQNYRTYNYQVCKLSKSGKIEFNEVHHSNIPFAHCSNDKLIYIYSRDFDVRFYDLVTKKAETFDVDQSLLPENIRLIVCCECTNKRFYSVIQFENTVKHGIMWADLTTKKWNLMEFEINLWISNLKFCNGNLIVKAESKCDKKLFNIPMRRPNHLRYSAWLLVVNVMKNNREKDPYKAAKEFLPLNSDLRAIWFKDEEKNDNKKKRKLY